MTAGSSNSAIDPTIPRQHRSKACDLLSRHGADGLLLFRDTNILGFLGVPLGPSDRLVCGLLNREGQAVILLPSFESDGDSLVLPHGRFCPWEEHQDPYVVLADAAAELGIASGRILLDPHAWVATQDRLAAALPRSTLSMDPGLIEAVRIVKSPEELEAIAAACRDTARIYPLIDRLLRPGVSEIELATEAAFELQRQGCAPQGVLVQGGPNAAVPHGRPGQRPVQSGDLVVVDFVAAKAGYRGDMTRTYVLGEPDSDAVRAYAVVRDAQMAAMDALRPGVTAESVDAAARSVIEQAGLGPFFVHRLGHGIGLDGHEPPFLVQGNRQRLEPGMCVTLEPGVYVPGRFGVRIEDVFTVTPDGCRRLSDTVPTDVSPSFVATV